MFYIYWVGYNKRIACGEVILELNLVCLRQSLQAIKSVLAIEIGKQFIAELR